MQFLGNSPKAQELLVQIQRAICSKMTITIVGESGVGKELVAKMIHENSNHRFGSFIKVNCAAIPENLLESEFFGHVKGAFTGAHANHKGYFAQAKGGTLLLDEINELPLSMQVKMLRAIEDKKVTPIGGTQNRVFNFHLICTTSVDLKKLCALGRFREDLFYRINSFTIIVPPLRERREDIPSLIDYALCQLAQENKTEQKVLSARALEFLQNYPWPGNVRELLNAVHNLCLLVDAPTIDLKDMFSHAELFGAEIVPFEKDTRFSDLSRLCTQIDTQAISLAKAKQEFEKLQIEKALSLYKGEVTAASRHLKMPRPQVSRLIKKYKIDKNKYKMGRFTSQNT